MGDEELAGLDKQTVEYEITVLEERLKQMTPNMAAIEEYKRKVCVWCGWGGWFGVGVCVSGGVGGLLLQYV